MRVVFMGTPELAAFILEEVAQHHEIVGVYTRPDAIRGRGKKLVGSPVKVTAERLELPVFTPKTLRDEAVQAELAALNPDVICVAAYGCILPKEVLELPQHGCLNVHASLLPRWRGAAPIERSILAGDEETGVCIMRMEEGLDTGDYCICRTLEIGDFDATYLTNELADMGASALLVALVHAEEGNLKWIAQDDDQAVYADKIQKGELNIDPSDTVVSATRKVRATSEGHVSKAVIGGKEVSVLKAACAPEDWDELSEIAQGAVRMARKRLFLGVSDGVIEVVKVKPAGKQAMDASAFAAGIQGIKSGTVVWEGQNA